MISEEATRLNVQVVAPVVTDGSPVYRLRDLWTTRDGSWEPSQALGSIPQWARDAGYLKPWGSPDYFDDAGGDHHAFGCVWDETNQRPFKQEVIHYYTWTDDSNHVDTPVKAQSGWANVVMYNKYYPDQGERGAWAWYPKGPHPADVVRGGGMPYGNHVSFFAAWTLTTGGIVVPPTDLEVRMNKFETWAIAWSKSYPERPQYGN